METPEHLSEGSLCQLSRQFIPNTFFEQLVDPPLTHQMPSSKYWMVAVQTGVNGLISCVECKFIRMKHYKYSNRLANIG